ncbi:MULTISPECIES: hypothetical protein [unclassified Mesorhizobium]|uniref:hypothetical protein n=1 Tax=unclassified Mesorhizobium TaxID=325217 RepID=UPI0010936A6A|nr:MULTISPECIES: hypothetical protein [unclassified Mesorhizobium]TGQ72900.1 hypothetical protein EN848_06120 [bacterium M00.F.Ca.ET.205.01.1.1]TGU53657.1 hypothetical protein EN795_10540 [bacterium M00.F.Ca.ET.152.01.1.1]TGV37155.1 hypothetical protein EN829_010565 [Mesorhizobium sp. M00.F.Ca.ET.186.01.1.1]TGZ41417.1 hypothetical protein EN805_17890 [bacterium M00.F.Ca.ET.162.01.1.1]TGT92067.1 hypothetical protein EN804_03155 [Mesorhizobium sp. M8A.F.Ca.ET.161.01.1.1]
MQEEQAGPTDPREEVGHAFRDALRLLFILVRGSIPMETPQDGWDRVFLGEKRALAIDFWLRYPDYLAEQLLDLHKSTGDGTLFDAAAEILREEEPDLRLVKMVRWRRGAYDDLQTSLAILGFRGLAKSMRRKLPNGGYMYEYLTGPLARNFLAEALSEQPGLAWYERQTTRALKVAQNKSGTALKDIHYAEEEYAGTPFGEAIPSIKERVLRRIAGTTGAKA